MLSTNILHEGNDLRASANAFSEFAREITSSESVLRNTNLFGRRA